MRVVGGPEEQSVCLACFELLWLKHHLWRGGEHRRLPERYGCRSERIPRSCVGLLGGFKGAGLRQASDAFGVLMEFGSDGARPDGFLYVVGLAAAARDGLAYLHAVVEQNMGDQRPAKQLIGRTLFGTCCKWFANKSYGFISPDATITEFASPGKHLFVHSGDVQSGEQHGSLCHSGPCLQMLVQGQRVSFRLLLDKAKRQWKAVEVHVLGLRPPVSTPVTGGDETEAAAVEVGAATSSTLASARLVSDTEWQHLRPVEAPLEAVAVEAIESPVEAVVVKPRFEVLGDATGAPLRLPVAELVPAAPAPAWGTAGLGTNLVVQAVAPGLPEAPVVSAAEPAPELQLVPVPTTPPAAVAPAVGDSSPTSPTSVVSFDRFLTAESSIMPLRQPSTAPVPPVVWRRDLR
jgi:cold shock CspA family protein